MINNLPIDASFRALIAAFKESFPPPPNPPATFYQIFVFVPTLSLSVSSVDLLMDKLEVDISGAHTAICGDGKMICNVRHNKDPIVEVRL